MSLRSSEATSTGDPRPNSAASLLSAHARWLFAGIAPSYEWVATILSLGQDPRWRHALVASAKAKKSDRVLDVATGTGMVARALVDRYGCRVVGLDQSADMLDAGLAEGHPLVRAQGERLPFADASFDHVTFTYLLRYVQDPAAKIIHAEGEITASQQLANAAEVIGRQPATLQLRYLQTLTEIAAEKNSTIVFPLPLDLVQMFLQSRGAGIGDFETNSPEPLARSTRAA